jgi:Protein of unknown function (DUF3107)
MVPDIGDQEDVVDVRIGVTYTAKEIDVELASDTDLGQLRSTVDRALSGEDKVLWLTDDHGRQVAVPTEKIAYVELGSPDGERRIGFASG